MTGCQDTDSTVRAPESNHDINHRRAPADLIASHSVPLRSRMKSSNMLQGATPIGWSLYIRVVNLEKSPAQFNINVKGRRLHRRRINIWRTPVSSCTETP